MEILFEDDHILVVNKPPGINTHAPDPASPAGIYETLKESRGNLAIHHRLDKETSGLLLFGKSRVANQQLSEQFLQRSVEKQYLFLTASKSLVKKRDYTSSISRNGEKYVSKPSAMGASMATTVFEPVGQRGSHYLVKAMPITGKTHQIRVHAAALGAPILGDTLYSGLPWDRLCLHAACLKFVHPATGQEMLFESKPDFDSPQFRQLRNALISEDTNAFRLIHSDADHFPGVFLDQFGEFALLQGEQPPSPEVLKKVQGSLSKSKLKSIYFKQLKRKPGSTDLEQVMPRHLSGDIAPDRFPVSENGLNYFISFVEGYSVGIFLDQRENRRRLLSGHIAPEWELPPRRKVLNTFAYTCAFSCAAARAGHHVTSLDLSSKYLDWGRENFTLNHLMPGDHDFIFGDTFSWLKRFRNKSRIFDLILLDPPTFSRSKESGLFQVEKDYDRLVAGALAVLAPDGVLFASTNAASLHPEKFLKLVRKGADDAKRKIVREQFYTQPPEFPTNNLVAPYLKTVWMQFD